LLPYNLTAEIAENAEKRRRAWEKKQQRLLFLYLKSLLFFSAFSAISAVNPNVNRTRSHENV
jgi:hypothetical protein